MADRVGVLFIQMRELSSAPKLDEIVRYPPVIVVPVDAFKLVVFL